MIFCIKIYLVSSQEVSADERKQLQKRKHLADKLKEEVIRK